MVLDVSYSRVLGQRPTFYCPLGFFYEKQAIRRRQFAAIDCDVFMCGSYRIAGSELPRGLAPYSIALETLCIAKCCKLNIKLTCTYFNPVHGFFTSRILYSGGDNNTRGVGIIINKNINKAVLGY